MLDVVQKKKQEGNKSLLSTFVTISVDNVGFLQSHAAVYSGDQHQSWQGTTVQALIHQEGNSTTSSSITALETSSEIRTGDQSPPHSVEPSTSMQELSPLQSSLLTPSLVLLLYRPLPLSHRLAVDYGSLPLSHRVAVDYRSLPLSQKPLTFSHRLAVDYGSLPLSHRVAVDYRSLPLSRRPLTFSHRLALEHGQLPLSQISSGLRITPSLSQTSTGAHATPTLIQTTSSLSQSIATETAMQAPSTSEQATPSLKQLSTNIQASEPNVCAQSSFNHSTEPSVGTHAHKPMGSAQPEPNNTATTHSYSEKPTKSKKKER